MKKLIITFLLSIILGHINAQTIPLHKSRSNTDKITAFIPKKMALIGFTDNMEARSTFERKMKERLLAYNMDAYPSIEISSIVFTEVEKAEGELNELIEMITQKGFDSFMITAVSRVEEKREDAEGYFGTYKVYHLETDIYSIEDKNISLLWGMCLDIYDYQLKELQIEDYVYAIILQMEYEDIVPANNEK